MAHPHIQPGDPYPLSAALHNDVVDLVNATRQPGNTRRPDAYPHRRREILNISGQTLNMYAVVGLGDPAIQPETTDDNFKFQIVFDSAEPADNAPFGILQNPCSPDGIAEVILFGVTWALIDVTDAAHEYANAIDGDYHKLRSREAPGPAFILWKEEGTGTKWALIIIDAGAAAGGITSITGQTGVAQTGPAITLTTGTTGTDFNIAGAANTFTFHLPSASTTARGVVTTGSQTIAGDKTLTGYTVGAGFKVTDTAAATTHFLAQTDATNYAELRGIGIQAFHDTGASETKGYLTFLFPSATGGATTGWGIHVIDLNTSPDFPSGSLTVTPPHADLTTWHTIALLKGYDASGSDTQPRYAVHDGSSMYQGAWATISGMTFCGGLYISGSLSLAADSVTNAALANFDAYSFLANLTNAAANPTYVQVGDLTEQASPASGLMFIAFDTDGSFCKVDFDNVGGTSLPVADTQTLVKGSADATKLWRVEVDGFTTGATRVFTPPDADLTITTFGASLVDDANAAAARTTLGATTVGGNYFTLANPGAITFPRMNADNTISALSAADFRTAIGAGTGSGDVSVTGNFPTDNRLVRTDGTAKNVQDSPVEVQDSGAIITPAQISCTFFNIKDQAGAGAEYLAFKWNENSGADLVLNWLVNGSSRTIDLSGNLTVNGNVTIDAAATQAQQETGTSTTNFVTPGRQHYHVSAAKAWANINGTAAPASLRASYNIASITDNGSGDYTLNFSTNFSSANYGFCGAAGQGASSSAGYQLSAPDTADPSSSAFRLLTIDAAIPSIGDAEFAGLAFFGDQ